MDYFELEELFEKAVMEYDETFNETLPEMELNNIPLKKALQNQVTLMLKWEIISKRLNYLFDEAEVLEESVYAHALKSAMHDKYRDVSYSEGKEYAKTDNAYQNIRRLKNKIRNYRDEARGILETVHSRKYILNNMTQSIVAGVENNIL